MYFDPQTFKTGYRPIFNASVVHAAESVLYTYLTWNGSMTSADIAGNWAIDF